MAHFRNKAEKKELQNFVDLLKKMLLVDQNGRIIPLKVLERLFFCVEQHTDSSKNMSIENLTADMKEAEPNVTQRPSSQKRSIHSSELCNLASKAMAPLGETVCTHRERVSIKLEGEENEAAHVQPEVVVDTGSTRAGCVKSFCQRISKAFTSCFQ